MDICPHSTHDGLDCVWIGVYIMDAVGYDYVANREDKPSILNEVREISLNLNLN